MVQKQHELARLVDEAGRRTVIPRVEILRLDGVDNGLFANQRVIILDVKHARGHLHAFAPAGQGQVERDVVRHVQPVTLGEVVEILIQPLGQKNVGVVLG